MPSPDGLGHRDQSSFFSHFSKGARILLKDGQELLGDSLAYDRKLGLGEAWGHVHVVDTANDILVRGD